MPIHQAWNMRRTLEQHWFLPLQRLMLEISHRPPEMWQAEKWLVANKGDSR